jgi:hypothetical protein
MSRTRMLTIILSVFACILFSSAIASAQIRTVLVSPAPGDPITSGTNLRNALANIPSPSSTNRWLLKIEPGIYQLQGNALVMRPWVDIEGSGIGATTIRLAAPTTFNVPTISGASQAELRLLTVEATETPAAMSNTNAHPRIYRVKFVATGQSGQAIGIENVSSAPRIEECEFFVSVPALSIGPTVAIGISFDSIAAGARSSILRSQIAVSGATINYGVRMSRGQTVAEIQDTRMDVTHGSQTYGIYALGGNWQGGENLVLRNIVINSAGGSSRSVGIWLESGSTVGLEIYNSKIWGHVAPFTQGIFQGGNIPVGLRYSSVLGFTKTVETVHNVGIVWTELIGGPVTGSPTSYVGCIAVVDEMGVFYANSCPP